MHGFGTLCFLTYPFFVNLQNGTHLVPLKLVI